MDRFLVLQTSFKRNSLLLLFKEHRTRYHRRNSLHGDRHQYSFRNHETVRTSPEESSTNRRTPIQTSRTTARIQASRQHPTSAICHQAVASVLSQTRHRIQNLYREVTRTGTHRTTRVRAPSNLVSPEMAHPECKDKGNTRPSSRTTTMRH